MHSADWRLHLAGGIFAFGTADQGVSFCDLWRIHGGHWRSLVAICLEFDDSPLCQLLGPILGA